MTGLLVTFIVFFVLLLAGGCALVVFRMLGNSQLHDRPRWPHRRARSPIHRGNARHSRRTV
jgi:hypothetical protein